MPAKRPIGLRLADLTSKEPKGKWAKQAGLLDPFCSSTFSWCATLEELANPTASPISRMLGG